MSSVSYNTVVLIVISTIIVLGGTSLVSIYLGKKTKSSEDWATGGRSIPIYVIIGTQFATAMGGGILVAHVGISYSNGWSALTYGLYLLFGISLLAVIAKWLREQKFTTVPDILEKLYGKNKTLINISSVLTILVPFGWICTQLVAFGNLYSTITGINNILLMVILGIVALAFVLPAGLSSVAWTDFIFGILMLVISLVSGIFAVNMSGGWQGIVANVPAEISSFPSGMTSIGWYTIALWGLSILPGTLTNQMYYQRIYAVDKVSQVRKSLIISAIVVFAADIWASYMGLSIRSMNPNIKNQEMAMGWFLTQVPNWFLVIYSGFLVAAIMSTIDSAIQSVAVNITQDIYLKNTKSEVSDKKLISMQRIVSVIIVILALVLAIGFPRALSWMVATYSYSAAGLLFPIFIGYFLKDRDILTAKGAIGSMLFGFIGCAIGQLTNASIPYVAHGLIGSFVGLFVISYFTKDEFNNAEIKADLN